MGVRFVQWARGVTVPEDFTHAQEQVVRRAYEAGVRHGKAKVADPIVEALGLRDEFTS